MGTDLADIQLISEYNKWLQYYVLSIFLVNMHEWDLQNTEKGLKLLMLFKKFCTSLIANETKYGYIKTGNFK